MTTTPQRRRRPSQLPRPLPRLTAAVRTAAAAKRSLMMRRWRTRQLHPSARLRRRRR
jgi:hypothetical protein